MGFDGFDGEAWNLTSLLPPLAHPSAPFAPMARPPQALPPAGTPNLGSSGGGSNGSAADDRPFVFIHLPKCGGTSVRAAVASVLQAADPNRVRAHASGVIHHARACLAAVLVGRASWAPAPGLPLVSP